MTEYVSSPKRARLYRLSPIKDRFWLKVDKRGPIRAGLGRCWIWIGSRDARNGYGSLRENRRIGKLLKAHRISWELHRGKIPRALFVLHRCDRRPCVNPDHLFLGTQADNSQDAARKGRLVFQRHPERCPRGENASAAKLTAIQVKRIRRLYAGGLVTQTVLAKRFGVTQAAIWCLLHDKSWKHIE